MEYTNNSKHLKCLFALVSKPVLIELLNQMYNDYNPDIPNYPADSDIMFCRGHAFDPFGIKGIEPMFPDVSIDKNASTLLIVTWCDFTFHNDGNILAETYIQQEKLENGEIVDDDVVICPTKHTLYFDPDMPELGEDELNMAFPMTYYVNDEPFNPGEGNIITYIYPYTNLFKCKVEDLGLFKFLYFIRYIEDPDLLLTEYYKDNLNYILECATKYEAKDARVIFEVIKNIMTELMELLEEESSKFAEPIEFFQEFFDNIDELGI